MEELLARLSELVNQTGIAYMLRPYFQEGAEASIHLVWQTPVMWIMGGFFIFLAIKKNIEPLLLLPIGFAILMVNMPLGGLLHEGGHGMPVGLYHFVYRYGLETEVVPCMIFLGLGALTDFGPLIANPKTLLLGAAAQVGVFIAFFGALLLGFDIKEACSIGITCSISSRRIHCATQNSAGSTKGNACGRTIRAI